MLPGSLARSSSIKFLQPAGVRFPVGITVINISGCLAIGLLAGLIASTRIAMSPAARDFAIVGILGGFTTFSTFGLDTLMLMRSNSPGSAAANVLVQVVGGVLAVWLGYSIGGGGK